MPDPVEGFTVATKNNPTLFAFVQGPAGWFTVESPGTKPDWNGVITLFSSRKLCTCLCTTFSRVFPRELRSEMGLWFSTAVLSSFLWIGETFAFFQMSGTVDGDREALNKWVQGSAIDSATSLRTRLFIWSGPHAFPEARDFNMAQTSSVWTKIDKREFGDCVKLGTALFLSSSCNWSWKYLLKTLAFSEGSFICILLWLSAGIGAVLFLPIRHFKVFHQSLPWWIRRPYNYYFVCNCCLT